MVMSVISISIFKFSFHRGSLVVYIQTFRGACVRIYTDILNLKRIRITLTKLSAYRAQNKSLRRKRMVRHMRWDVIMLLTRFQKPHFGIGPQLSDDLNSPGTLDLD